MPKISTYGTVTPSPSDLIVVSDANDSKATKNITVGSLSSATAPSYYVDAFSNTEATTDITSSETYTPLNIVFAPNLFDGYTVANNIVANTNTEATTLLSQVTVVLTLQAADTNVITGVITNETPAGVGTDISSSTSSVTADGANKFNLVMTCITNLTINHKLKIKLKNSVATDIVCSHASIVVHSI